MRDQTKHSPKKLQAVILPVNKIRAGNNDRTIFDQDELKKLAETIREHGVIQPITVNQVGKTYEIIAGERRYRATILAGLPTIPAIVKKVDARTASALMLAENISRADLDPIDEGNAYQKRIDQGWTLEELSASVGKSLIKIQFRLKLLSLRDDLQSLVRSGNLLIGYAQIICDANLDTNRQLLAVKTLRDNPRPTLGWFRNVVNQYLEQQNSISLFDTGNFLVLQQETITSKVIEPPHPATTTPPSAGKTPAEILKGQIDFWRSAAQAWEEIGKPFKKQECEAAVQALAHVINFL